MIKFHFKDGQVGDRVTFGNDENGEIISMSLKSSHCVVVQMDCGEIELFNYYGFSTHSPVKRLYMDDKRETIKISDPMQNLIVNQQCRIDWLEEKLADFYKIFTRANKLTDEMLVKENGVN
jgi:hypothetical protein